MAGLKEIKRRLKSVRNTKKITYAMKLVSAAKLRKAQEAVASAREYSQELNVLLSALAAATSHASFEHPLMDVREEVRRVAVFVIGGQRGLCGGYNSNLHKRISSLQRDIAATPGQPEVRFYVFGKKPAEFLRRSGRKYERSWEELTENALAWPVEEAARILEEGFMNAEFDEVHILFTRLKSAISQKVVVEKILPVSRDALASALEASGESASAAASSEDAGVMLFEPSAREVFEALIPRFMSSQVRQACLDAKASETASRMTAMDAATKNASELGRKLELTHNRIRQAGITSQLLDIIGGAEAIK